jgi:hypothetical protein
MMSETRIMKQWMLVAAGLGVMLAGCGGEGSGSTPPSSSLSFSVAPSSLSFSGVGGDTLEPPAQRITIQGSGGTVYLELAYAGIAYEATPLQLSGTTATATVRVPSPKIAGAGTHTGTVTIRGYEYPFGGTEVAGSPKQANVTYTVSGLAASPSLLVFNQTAGSFPAAQSVTLSLSPAATDGWSAAIEYVPISGLTVPNWLQVSPLGGSTLPATLSVSVVAQGQPGIMYDGYINVTATNGSTLRYHVIYRAH